VIAQRAACARMFIRSHESMRCACSASTFKTTIARIDRLKKIAHHTRALHENLRCKLIESKKRPHVELLDMLMKEPVQMHQQR
jgi:hypothetical protein